jgi:hypothetical protein
VTAIVVAHLLVAIAHGLAHRELRVGLDPLASIFVILVVLVSPLLAMALVWTTKKRIGLILLSLSMFGSLLFGFYHHFLVASPDHIHSQPSVGALVALKRFVIGALNTFAVSSRGSQEALCGGSCLCSFFPQRASRKRIALQLF